MEVGAAVYIVLSTDPPDDIRIQEYQSIVRSGIYNDLNPPGPCLYAICLILVQS